MGNSFIWNKENWVAGEYVLSASLPRNSTYLIRLFVDNKEISNSPLSIILLTSNLFLFSKFSDFSIFWTTGEQSEQFHTYTEKGKAIFFGEMMTTSSSPVPVELRVKIGKCIKLKKKNVFSSKITEIPLDRPLAVKLNNHLFFFVKLNHFFSFQMTVLSANTIQLFHNHVYIIRLNSLGLFEVTLEKFLQSGAYGLNNFPFFSFFLFIHQINLINVVMDVKFFDKFTWFVEKLTGLCPSIHVNTLNMTLTRDNLLFDVAKILKNSSPEFIREAKLFVSFVGEEGMDYGGVSKEFYHLISKAMTSSKKPGDYVFFSSPGENEYYLPDPFSSHIDGYQEVFWYVTLSFY